jgi:predicted RNase H-like HicB family nuclease
MKFTIEYEREDDGRWLAEIVELPGVMAYGNTPDEAIGHAKALALRAVADQIEHDERSSSLTEISFAMAA